MALRRSFISFKVMISGVILFSSTFHAILIIVVLNDFLVGIMWHFAKAQVHFDSKLFLFLSSSCHMGNCTPPVMFKGRGQLPIVRSH